MQCKKKGNWIMKLNENDYIIELVTDGGYFAYFMNNILCSAYGDTPDEARDNLEQIVDEFVNDMFMVEDFI